MRAVLIGESQLFWALGLRWVGLTKTGGDLLERLRVAGVGGLDQAFQLVEIIAGLSMYGYGCGEGAAAPHGTQPLPEGAERHDQIKGALRTSWEGPVSFAREGVRRPAAGRAGSRMWTRIP